MHGYNIGTLAIIHCKQRYLICQSYTTELESFINLYINDFRFLYCQGIPVS